MNKKKMLIYIVHFFNVLILDRVTKYAIIYYLPYLYINSFLSIDLVFNRGVSWGLFHSNDCTTFAIVNCVIACIIVGLILHTINRIKHEQNVLGETLILAGAISNFGDRFIYQGVVDFISVSYQNWYFPIFNVADIYIVIGVLFMMFLEYKEACKK